MTSVNKRVLKDIQEGKANLLEECGIHIAPEEEDYYKVHFILQGPEESPFDGGLYHGVLHLNNEHPLKPPRIYMFTPSGRFTVEHHPIPKDRGGICTNFTAYHPESWTPVCNIETVLKGFGSFMCDLELQGVGGILSKPAQIIPFTKKSIDHIKHDEMAMKLFPELWSSLVDKTFTRVKLSDMSKKKTEPVKEIEYLEEESSVEHSDNKKKGGKESKGSKGSKGNKGSKGSKGNNKKVTRRNKESSEESSEESSSEEIKKRNTKEIKKRNTKKIINEPSEESSEESSDDKSKKRNKKMPQSNAAKKKKVTNVAKKVSNSKKL